MIPFNITFRNFPSSDTIWIDVQEHVKKLEKFYKHITSCDVIISAPHRHHRKGKIFHIDVHLHVPGAHLIVNHEPEKYGGHEDIYVVIADVFKAMGRKLEDYIRRRRRIVKKKNVPPHAFISQIYHDYGFIETPEGRELYFDKNAVTKHGFNKLKIGTEVRFSEEAGIKGPQVTSMSIVGKEGRHLGIKTIQSSNL